MQHPFHFHSALTIKPLFLLNPKEEKKTKKTLLSLLLLFRFFKCFGTMSSPMFPCNFTFTTNERKKKGKLLKANATCRQREGYKMSPWIEFLSVMPFWARFYESGVSYPYANLLKIYIESRIFAGSVQYCRSYQLHFFGEY